MVGRGLHLDPSEVSSGPIVDQLFIHTHICKFTCTHFSIFILDRGAFHTFKVIQFRFPCCRSSPGYGNLFWTVEIFLQKW